MNTLGMLRGYMAKSKDTKRFIEQIVETLNKEFQEVKEGVKLETTDKEFIITMDKYELIISKDKAEELKSPYGIDKHILDEFDKQGFKFDKNRSQYIQYCYGNFGNAELVNVKTE